MNTPAHESECCHHVVLGAVQRPRRRVVLFASVAALVLHVGAVAAALAVSAPRNDHRPARHSPPLVVIDHVIDLTPPAAEPVVEPPPPPPPPEPKTPPRIKQKAPPPDKAAETPVAQPEAPPPPPDAPEPVAPPSEPPPAAQAGQVVAAADSNAPAAFNIATGAGSGYAGGTTSAGGTGTKANHTGQVGVGDGAGHSHARPPQLHSRNWPCGWPSEAEDLELEEAFVTVRASVSASGEVTDVEVLADPGHGFGKRASLCARSRVSFEPALDAAGSKIAGKTPPLRIRFVRDEE